MPEAHMDFPLSVTAGFCISKSPDSYTHPLSIQQTLLSLLKVPSTGQGYKLKEQVCFVLGKFLV